MSFPTVIALATALSIAAPVSAKVITKSSKAG